MEKKLTKHGNSIALVIDKPLLKMLNFDENTTLVLSIQGESLIMTAGAIDACAYFTSPDVVTEAIMSGVTTMFGGGTGMNGSVTMSTPGPNHIKYMIQATDDYPMNFGFYGKGNTSKAEGLSKELEDQIVAGAIG